MSNKNVLAILGSPHANGITAAMLDHAVYEAEKAGYSVNKLNLYKKELAFCSGCRKCINTGICVKMDDIHEIVSLIKESDIIVLAAPVYWANVPAPVKNLFDRLLGTAMEETKAFPKPKLSGKKYIILTACNTPAPFSWIFGQSRGAIKNMKEFFKTAGMKPAGRIVCTNASERTELPESVLKKIRKCWK